jgi:hypothetical protein
MDSFGLSVGNREARADRQGGTLVDRIASGMPIRKLLFIEAFGPSFASLRAAGSPPRVDGLLRRLRPMVARQPRP